MNVGELTDFLAERSREDYEVVIEELYPSIPVERLDEDEVDDYGGLPTGKYLDLTGVSIQGNKVILSFD